MAKRSVPRKPRIPTTKHRRSRLEKERCPLCGLEVNKLFGVEAHQRGARCKAVLRARALERSELVRIPSQLGAALLLQPVLADLLTQDYVGVGNNGKPQQGYWGPEWILLVLRARDAAAPGPDVAVADAPLEWAEAWTGYTTPSTELPPIVLRVLRRLAATDEDEREVLVSALRLGGWRGLRDVLGAPPVEGAA